MRIDHLFAGENGEGHFRDMGVTSVEDSDGKLSQRLPATSMTFPVTPGDQFDD